MPAPWHDTPIIALFESNFNDYSMRVRTSLSISFRARRRPCRRRARKRRIPWRTASLQTSRVRKPSQNSLEGLRPLQSSPNKINSSLQPALRQIAFERHRAAQLDHLVAQRGRLLELEIFRGLLHLLLQLLQQLDDLILRDGQLADRRASLVDTALLGDLAHSLGQIFHRLVDANRRDVILAVVGLLDRAATVRSPRSPCA